MEIDGIGGRGGMLRARHEFETPPAAPYKVSWGRPGADNERPAGRAAARNGSMGTVLEDVTSDTVDAQHIRRRVDDWE